MIRADEQRLPWADAMLGIVREHECRAAADHAAVTQDREIDIKRDLPQRYHDPDFRQQLQLPLEERSEEHTSELQSHSDLVCRLLLEKKKTKKKKTKK